MFHVPFSENKSLLRKVKVESLKFMLTLLLLLFFLHKIYLAIWPFLKPALGKKKNIYI